MKVSQKYLDTYVTIGLILATIIACAALFLSSVGAAEASYGDLKSPLSVYITGKRDRIAPGLDRVSALAFWPTTSPFERPQEPVRFIYVWPKLPSTTEQLTKIAQDRLADLVFRMEKEKAAEREALKLRLDWEAFQKALGLFFMAVGTIVTVVLGIGGARARRRL